MTMRKINEVFFAGENEKGLTSSSANYLANLAGEQVAETAELLNKVSFVDMEISIVGSSDKILASKGMPQEVFDQIPTLIQRHGKLKAFSAWIREAIKAKEVELKDSKSLSFNRWVINNNLELPKLPDKKDLPELPEKPSLEEYPETPIEPVKPLPPTEVTESDVLENWSIKDRNRYWEVEALAATYGKLIHKDGSINLGRDTLHMRIANPVETDLKGRDTIVKYYGQSIPVDQVDQLFNRLQDLYRSSEKELNSMKFRIKEEMEAETQRRYSEYQQSINEYNEQLKAYARSMDDWKTAKVEVDLRNKKLLQEWDHECDRIRKSITELQLKVASDTEALRSQFESYKSDLINKVSKLKIRIPESHLEIFHYLDSLGKSE